MLSYLLVNMERYVECVILSGAASQVVDSSWRLVSFEGAHLSRQDGQVSNDIDRIPSFSGI